MTAVTIHSCTLRIVRRGGWSWGADPRELLNNVVRRLPELIARQLASLFDEQQLVEIRSPLRIRVGVALADLRSVVQPGASRGSAAGAVSVLRARIIAALAPALRGASIAVPSPSTEGAALVTSHPGASLDEQPRINSQTAELARHPPPALRERTADRALASPRPRAAADILLAWHEQGELAVRLRSFALPALRAWHDRILAPPRAPHPSASVLAIEPNQREGRRVAVEHLLRQIARSIDFPQPSVPARLRARIVAAIEASGQIRLPIADRLLRDVLDATMPMSNRATPAHQLANNRSVPVPRRGESAEAPGSALASSLTLAPCDTAARLAGEVRIASVLPFLVAGSLARLGWIDVMTGVLDAEGLLDHWPVVATALAYKTLGPVERGWRRDPDDVRAAAAFAGVAQHVTGELIARLARRLSDSLSPVDGLLAHAVISGRDPHRPLLLAALDQEHRARPPLVIIDIDGAFPIAWGDHLEDIAQVLEQCETTLLMIESRTANADLLLEVHQAGLRFLAQGPSVRGERWREIRDRTGKVWMTNDISSKPRLLVAQGAALPQAMEAAARTHLEIVRKRPSAPASREPALDRSLTLAAAIGLGDIAWRLWNRRERTDPVLALERFGDLGARVQFGPRAVRVVLPLGQRSSDLDSHGFLRDVRWAPWLDGRSIVFARG